VLEEHFPVGLAEEWDNVGLQLGSCQKEVSRVMVALDTDRNTVRQVQEKRVDLLVTHHPLFFKSVDSLNFDTPQGWLAGELTRAGVTVYAAHTNLDAAPGGLNQFLAEKLGLEEITPFQRGREEHLFKLVVYIPRTHLEEVREAICTAGAGFIGSYSDCTFRVAGTGTFMPREGSHPFIGEVGRVEEVEEYRLETVVPERRLSAVLGAMWSVHPYEEVAYDLYRLSNRGIIHTPGRRGLLPEPMNLNELAELVKRRLNLPYVLVVGDGEDRVRQVGVVSGSGASFLRQARAEGLDVLVTGDLKYHDARDAEALGLNVIDAGHYGTEIVVVQLLAGLLQREAKARKWGIEVIEASSQPPVRLA